MLKIWTDESLSPLPVIIDAEAFFLGKRRSLSLDDDLSLRVMKEIDGVSFKKGDYIETRYGGTDISKLSTGCKVALLCLNFKDSNCISFIEAGENVFWSLYKISEEYNLDFNIHLNRVIGMSLGEPKTLKINNKLYENIDLYEALEVYFE